MNKAPAFTKDNIGQIGNKRYPGYVKLSFYRNLTLCSLTDRYSNLGFHIDHDNHLLEYDGNALTSPLRKELRLAFTQFDSDKFRR